MADYPIEFPQNELIKMIMELIPKRLIDNVDRHEDADFVYHVGEERYRVNIYYEQTNICAAIRVINDEILTLEQLEMPTVLNQIAMEPRGLVLVTGPTGSGKSTTLAAMIDLVNKQRNCHILTIEDPIEYVYKQKQALIHQREIGEDVKDFDMALRSAMREDPDVILVGEMRDYETISAVITLAETGHLVFSTLHTIGAAKTIDRIIDIFPSACALVAKTLVPQAMDYVMASHLSAEKAAKSSLENLGLEAYVDLGLCLGEASGGSIQMGMLDLAVHMYLAVTGGKARFPLRLFPVI